MDGRAARVMRGFGREPGIVHILEQTSEGKWITNMRWAVLYPIHRMGTSDLLLKSGRYRIDEKGVWEYYGATPHSMATLLPELTSVNLSEFPTMIRRQFYNHPITVDFRAYWRRSETKCYILEPSNTVFEEVNHPGTLIRKIYYDKIMKLHNSATAISPTAPGRPVLFVEEHVEDPNKRSLVGFIMPVNYGNAKDRSDRFEEEYEVTSKAAGN